MTMELTDLIGMIAGILTTISLVPQALKIWKTRSAEDVSFGMFALFSLGVILWLAYGVLIHALPIVVANSVTLVLAGSIIYMKWLFRSE
ncbi:MAG: hypothetical protein H6R26_247 [Proteobacteria bacterium]|nr:hypothetical protein [Pseudomonadota bacterium]